MATSCRNRPASYLFTSIRRTLQRGNHFWTRGCIRTYCQSHAILIGRSIDANPSLDFVVIVNPNSGPGSPPWWPNLDYLREVPKLNARSNCTTLGYVRVDYCNRDVAEVVEEVHQYAQWSQQNGVKGLHVSGIFFDETPNMSSQFKTTYLTKIDQEVKATNGILGERLVCDTHADRRHFVLILATDHPQSRHLTRFCTREQATRDHGSVRRIICTTAPARSRREQASCQLRS